MLRSWLAGRRGRRRGGLLELDTWEARNALELRQRSLDPVESRSSLQRCNPERGVHFHGAGDRCECGRTANVVGLADRLEGPRFHPFAGRRREGDA
jgi:hypothetical protein